MAVTREEIINTSLVQIGHDTIPDLNTEVGRAALLIYNREVSAALSSFPWNFAQREVLLSQLTDLGAKYSLQYEYAYSLPSDFYRAIRLVDGNFNVAVFNIAGNQLYTDVDSEATLLYSAKVAESFFAPYFVEALSFQLAALYSVAVADNSQRAGVMLAEARHQWARARSADAQQGPNQSFTGPIKRTISRFPTARP